MLEDTDSLDAAQSMSMKFRTQVFHDNKTIKMSFAVHLRNHKRGMMPFQGLSTPIYMQHFKFEIAMHLM